MTETIERGTTYGRWTVMRTAPPKHVGRQKRQQVACRCVCGKEKLLEPRDLEAGRTSGCKSGRCREQWAIDQAVEEARERALLEGHQQAAEVERQRLVNEQEARAELAEAIDSAAEASARAIVEAAEARAGQVLAEARAGRQALEQAEAELVEADQRVEAARRAVTEAERALRARHTSTDKA